MLKNFQVSFSISNVFSNDPTLDEPTRISVPPRLQSTDHCSSTLSQDLFVASDVDNSVIDRCLDSQVEAELGCQS